jgi:choline dehydrogenase-like flavoprotein
MTHAAGVLNCDFLIIGGGSAGSALAYRLSQNGRFRVLLLEAGGGDRRLYVQLPLGYGKTFYDTRVNWTYMAEVDPGLGGRRDYWPRGKILGGSSSINAMVYVRGHPHDYKDWKNAGNPGWDWIDADEAFRSMESNSDLRIYDPRQECHPLCADFIESAKALGLRFNDDFSGPDQEGVGYYRITTKDGRRMSAARAFLKPAMNRKNVRVETHAHVLRILFEGRRALGVEFLKDGKVHRAIAEKEIIVSAGAVNSVQLLQLSGIGPSGLLRRIGIEVKSDNANVGANLQDHIGINYTWRMRVPTLNEELRSSWGKLRAGAHYLITRSGPLSLSINQAGGFFRTSIERRQPNMQLYMQPFSTIIPKEGERPILTPDPFPGMSLGISNCRPASRGHISIRSDDPFAPPRIVPNVFACAADMDEMLEAVKFLRQIAVQEPLSRSIEAELRPGPTCMSDDQLVEDIRLRCGTVYHPCCTCRMGPSPDVAVVDARLRVHGFQHLRICDASVFPNIISGNINAACMMVGWRGAGLILEDYA